MNENELPLERVLDYMLGGNAHITVANDETGNQVKFRIKQKKENGQKYKFWYVANTSGLLYLGHISENMLFVPSAKNKLIMKKEIEVFQWLWKRVAFPAVQLKPNIHIYHSGTCGCCNRPLTDAESLRRGIGPECWAKMGH